jgi:hypothetical protein
MKYDKWLATIPIQQTEKGARLDLRLYIYPDGHGNFLVADEGGRVAPNSQPVNTPAEAREVLEKIWNLAMSSKAGASAPPPAPRRSIAEQLGDLIGSVPELPPDMAEHHDHYLHGAPKE